MSAFASLSLVACGCLRCAGGFLLGAEPPLVPPAGLIVPLTPRRTFRRPPDRWQLAVALGELWAAGRTSAGDHPVFLRGRQDADTGVTTLDAVIVLSGPAALPAPAKSQSAVQSTRSALPA